MVKKGDVAAKFHTEGDDVFFFWMGLKSGWPIPWKNLETLENIESVHKRCTGMLFNCVFLFYVFLFFVFIFYISHLQSDSKFLKSLENTLKSFLLKQWPPCKWSFQVKGLLIFIDYFFSLVGEIRFHSWRETEVPVQCTLATFLLSQHAAFGQHRGCHQHTHEYELCQLQKRCTEKRWAFID